MAITQTKTKEDKLKAKVLVAARELLRLYDEDIESGIEDGTYEESENIDTRKFIKKAEKLFDEFEKSRPSVYVYVQGGNVQGASASADIGFEVYDKDNADVDENYRDGETPEQWDEWIKKATAKNEIKGIY